MYSSFSPYWRDTCASASSSSLAERLRAAAVSTTSRSGASALAAAVWKAEAMLLPMVMSRTMLSRKAGNCEIMRRWRLSARSHSRK